MTSSITVRYTTASLELDEKVHHRRVSKEEDKLADTQLRREPMQLRAAVLCGSGIDVGMHVEAHIAEHAFESGEPVVRAGLASFLNYSHDQGDAPAILRNKYSERKFWLPSSQLLDVIIYVCRGTEKLAFKRINAKMLHSFEFNPEWHELLPIEPSSSKLDVSNHPTQSSKMECALYMSIGLDREANVPKNLAPLASLMPLRNQLCPYELRLHAYMARDLPAMDADGAIDPVRPPAAATPVPTPPLHNSPDILTRHCSTWSRASGASASRGWGNTVPKFTQIRCTPSFSKL